MTEKEFERRMCELIKRRGGLTYKLVGLVNGLPDRIVILPGGRVIFVELKSDTGRLSKLQRFRIKEMEKVGAEVRVLRGFNDVKNFIEGVMPMAGADGCEVIITLGKLNQSWNMKPIEDIFIYPPVIHPEPSEEQRGKGSSPSVCSE
jgi:hypothetical protein